MWDVRVLPHGDALGGGHHLRTVPDLVGEGADPDLRFDEGGSGDVLVAVIELVGARNVRSTLAALAQRGRCIFVASQGDEDLTFRLRDFKTKRLTFVGSTLRRRDRDAEIAAVRRFERECLPWLADGKLVPTISRIYPATRARDAFEYLGESGKFGRVLLDFAAEGGGPQPSGSRRAIREFR